jgi:hypothetical protein
MAFYAPRILNDPVFCRFSHLKNNCAPASLSKDWLVSIGVRWMRGLMRSCASPIVLLSMWLILSLAVGLEVAISKVYSSPQREASAIVAGHQ